MWEVDESLPLFIFISKYNDIMSFKLRSSNAVNVPLTWTEMDNNLSYLLTNMSGSNISFTGNVTPTVNNIYSLGTSLLKWNNVYATTFIGTATTASNITPAITNNGQFRILTSIGDGTLQAENTFTFNGTTINMDNVRLQQGLSTGAFGDSAHAEGASTTANGDNSHAEGSGTTANGESSHAEGSYTISSGQASHAEGTYTTSSGVASHAEGTGSKATGNYSHAEGATTIASGIASHAEGQGTVASGDYQLVIGQYNIANTTSSFIVGGGSVSTPKTIFDVRVDSNKSGSIMVPTNDSNPSNPLTGSMYFDYKGGRIWVYNGTAWKFATLS